MRNSDTGAASQIVRPELVVAVVSAIGTRVDPVIDALADAFMTVSYSTERIRISESLERLGSDLLPKQGDISRSQWLMDLGDKLREETRLGGAAVCLALLEMRAARSRSNVDAESGERLGTVTVIRSIKRADEVDMLRSVYGSRLLVIGVSAAEDDRRAELTRQVRSENGHHRAEWYAGEVDALLRRDQHDESNPFGQRVRKAFALADAFIWQRQGSDPDEAALRLVRAWFGHPFTTPTLDEQAMFYAQAAMYRSAATGRQVGAAIVDESGDLMVTGTNDVPKPGGGQYWPGDDPDHRDFTLRFEMNDRIKLDVGADTLGRLAREGWLSPDRKDSRPRELAQVAFSEGGPLVESRISDLIEFGRILHAEMAAICSAARRGISIADATLYTTTYPCHECARLIIGSGIRRVIYIDPYPKSQVQTLFEHLVTSDPDYTGRSKVQIVPFEGVAPSLFADVYRMNQRKRDVDGTLQRWEPSPLAVRAVVGRPAISDENFVLDEFAEASAGAAWLQNGQSPEPSA